MEMKIYVAASFEQKEEVRRAQRIPIQAGHEITLDWTAHKQIAHSPNSEELSRQYAVDDVEGVKSADAYVLLLGDRKSAGAHIELGIAIGASLEHIILVGEIKDFSLFYMHSQVKNLPDIASVVELLN